MATHISILVREIPWTDEHTHTYTYFIYLAMLGLTLTRD